MAETKVKVTVITDGPLLIEGTHILSKEGTAEATEKTYICRCGESQNQPYCDGSHKNCKTE